MKNFYFFSLISVVLLTVNIGCNIDTGIDDTSIKNEDFDDTGDYDKIGCSEDDLDCEGLLIDTDAFEIVEPCSEDNKFCLEHNGLLWSNISVDHMIWSDAVVYCENIGGRLPTISELRTLIQNCPATEPEGSCGVVDDCLSSEKCWSDLCRDCKYDFENPNKYSVFGDPGYLWSSSQLSDNEHLAWLVGFNLGNIHHYDSTDGRGYARCLGIVE